MGVLLLLLLLSRVKTATAAAAQAVITATSEASKSTAAAAAQVLGAAVRRLLQQLQTLQIRVDGVVAGGAADGVDGEGRRRVNDGVVIQRGRAGATGAKLRLLLLMLIRSKLIRRAAGPCTTKLSNS